MYIHTCYRKIHITPGLAVVKLRALYHNQMRGKIDTPRQCGGCNEDLWKKCVYKTDTVALYIHM